METNDRIEVLQIVKDTLEVILKYYPGSSTGQKWAIGKAVENLELRLDFLNAIQD